MTSESYLKRRRQIRQFPRFPLFTQEIQVQFILTPSKSLNDINKHWHVHAQENSFR